MRISEEEQKRFSEWKAKVNNAFDNVKQNKEDKFEKIVPQLNDELDSYYKEICANTESPDFLQKYMGYVRMAHFLQAKIKYFPQETWTGKYPEWFQKFENLNDADEKYRKSNNELSRLREIDLCREDYRFKDGIDSILNYLFGTHIRQDREPYKSVLNQLTNSEIHYYVYRKASEDVEECNFYDLLNEDEMNHGQGFYFPSEISKIYKLPEDEFSIWEKMIEDIIGHLKICCVSYDEDLLIKKDGFDAFAKLVCYLAKLSNGFITPNNYVIQCPESIYIYIAQHIAEYIYTDEFDTNEKDPNIFPIKSQHGNKNENYKKYNDDKQVPEVPEYAQSKSFKEWLQRLSSIATMKLIKSTDTDLVAFAKEMFKLDITQKMDAPNEFYVQFLSDYFDSKIKTTYNKRWTIQAFSDEEKEILIDWVYNFVQNKLPDMHFERRSLEDFIKYGVNNGRLLEELRSMMGERFSFNKTTVLQIALDTMFTLHNSWISKHAQEINCPNANIIKFLPPELIGFDGLARERNIVKVFLNQLYNMYSSYDIIKTTSLKDYYDSRVKEFFLNNGITSKEKLVKKISQGSLSYEPLGLTERYNEYLAQSEGSSITFEEYCKTITNSLPIDETRRNIADKILTDPNASEKDVKRLTAAEIARRLNETIRLADITSLLQHLNNDPKVIAAYQRRNDLSSNEKNEESYQQ